MASANLLGNLFGRSPIGPIQEHMQVANQAAQLLPDLFRAAAAGDWNAAKASHRKSAGRPTRYRDRIVREPTNRHRH